MLRKRARRPAHWLALLALCLQAAIPLGQAVSLPGSAEPLVICSAFGLRTVYVDAEGRRLPPGEEAPRGAQDPCVVCLSLTAAALQPPLDIAPAPPAPLAAASGLGRNGFQPQAMPRLLGIFARPPPLPA